MQFGFRFQILLFTTSVRFSTKTLTYLAYKAFKAFMTFKRSRLNPFQNYRSTTSFSVDWTRTIRLVYASVSILSVYAIMLQVIVIQTRQIQNDWQKSIMTKNLVVCHVTRPSPCMTTSIIKKITRVISMWTPHWITVSCHGVEGPMTTGYYCAIFSILWRRKKKRRQKSKGILWLGYHRYPSNELKTKNVYPQPRQRCHPWGFRVSYKWHAIHSNLT